MGRANVAFVVPGSLEQRSGGTRYDKRIIAGLQKSGNDVETIELRGVFPFCNRTTECEAVKVLGRVSAATSVVIDGLALPAFAKALPKYAARLNVIALVHHPLAYENGLAPKAKQQLFRLERELLRYVRTVITTSSATAELMYAYDVDASRLAVVSPGTDPVRQMPRSPSDTVRLLCVASVIARKGHSALIAALANCASLKWRLDCYGALDRDPELTLELRALIARFGMAGRVFLHGEVDDTALTKAYRTADVFVLASAFEGYGMAYAEAMAHGLPIVASGDGAVRDTVPETAGILVPADSSDRLSNALMRIVSDPSLRAHLASGALEAARSLPNWAQSADAFAKAVLRSKASNI